MSRPMNRDEVVQKVKQARISGTPIFPVSTGLNWGYRAARADGHGAEVMDLSGMNRILNADEISVDHPVAVIEPGVTQGQLCEFLDRRCPALSFNVTGSARDTSIIGNALDRGVGYLGPRREDLFGLEIVTGIGEVICTGFRRLGERSPLAHCHPYGLGPMLDGLFFQGNFGIVTSACFKLVPKAPVRVAVSLALRRESDLAALLDELARLKREAVMSTTTHVGNKVRTHSSLMYGVAGYLMRQCGVQAQAVELQAQKVLERIVPHAWSSLGGISGTRAQVRAAVAEVRSRVKRWAQVRIVDDRLLASSYALLHPLRRCSWARDKAAAIAAMRPLHGLASGAPTDAAVDNLLWRYGQPELPAHQFDRSRCGLLYISPALPMDGHFAADVVRQMTLIAAQHHHTLYVTLNIETPTSLVAITNLLFDRGQTEACERAHRCADALWTYIRSRGLEVYRARDDMMDRLVDAASPYWRTVRALKQVFDPDNIIAPGHYNLTP